MPQPASLPAAPTPAPRARTSTGPTSTVQASARRPRATRCSSASLRPRHTPGSRSSAARPSTPQAPPTSTTPASHHSPAWSASALPLHRRSSPSRAAIYCRQQGGNPTPRVLDPGRRPDLRYLCVGQLRVCGRSHRRPQDPRRLEPGELDGRGHLPGPQRRAQRGGLRQVRIRRRPVGRPRHHRRLQPSFAYTRRFARHGIVGNPISLALSGRYLVVPTSTRRRSTSLT